MAQSGIALLIERYNLTRTHTVRKFTGDRCLEDNSKKQYQSSYNGMIYFCMLIGDYDSLLILQEIPLNFAQSINPKTIVNFILFKTGDAGSLLVDSDGNAIFDVNRERIRCQGTWTDPKCAKLLISALAVLHMTRGQGGPFTDKCDECIRHRDEGRNTGCGIPHQTPELWRRGDVTKTEAIKNCVKSILNKGRGYVMEGDLPVSPQELKRIRNYLISSNTLENFMVWTMFLLGCRLFLRSDELIDINGLTVDSIMKSYSIVDKTGMVSGLAFKVMVLI